MAKLISLPTFTDPRGALTVVDRVLPFEIKRVFFIHDVKADRGGHGHKKARVAMIALSGSVRVFSQSPQTEAQYVLSNPTQCLILEPEDWHSMHDFGPHTSLVVLASEYYDKDDYFYEKYR